MVDRITQLTQYVAQRDSTVRAVHEQMQQFTFFLYDELRTWMNQIARRGTVRSSNIKLFDITQQLRGATFDWDISRIYVQPVESVALPHPNQGVEAYRAMFAEQLVGRIMVVRQDLDDEEQKIVDLDIYINRDGAYMTTGIVQTAYPSFDRENIKLLALAMLESLIYNRLLFHTHMSDIEYDPKDHVIKQPLGFTTRSSTLNNE